MERRDRYINRAEQVGLGLDWARLAKSALLYLVSTSLLLSAQNREP